VEGMEYEEELWFGGGDACLNDNETNREKLLLSRNLSTG
jgi:hypothetical protein